MENFKKLGLSENLLKAIEEFKFTEPSEIQEKSIPLILQGKDVMGQSATGSGKTLAFGAGIVDKIKNKEGIQALVLTPTRELAEQVSKSLQRFSKHQRLKVIEIYGGVAISPQIENIKRAEVVVGTPGRILDHLRQGTLSLKKVTVLVLDEADRMLDMGFIEDIQKIIEHCPKERQTLLFSATISQDIERIGRRYMNNAVVVTAESYVDASKLHQVYYDVPQDMKFSLLVHLLKKEHSGLIMIFCNTRRNADFIAKNLKRYGLDVNAIHGGLSQNKRSRVMDIFHSQEVTILVCTDVAARGLDIKNVSHIYNYDISKTSTEYVHRVGRTARAGKEGMAISLVSARDYDNFRRVLEDDALKIVPEKMPEIERLGVNFTQSDDRSRGRSFGGRNFGSGGRGRPYSSGYHNNRGGSSYGRHGDDRGRGGSRGGRSDRSSHGGSSRDGGSRGGYGRDRESRGRSFGGRGRAYGSSRGGRRY